MYHDTEKIGCSRREGGTLHVMTPSFEADAIEVVWSSCSRRDITNFLEWVSDQQTSDYLPRSVDEIVFYFDYLTNDIWIHGSWIICSLEHHTKWKIRHAVGFCNLWSFKSIYNSQFLKIFLHKFPFKEKTVARKSSSENLRSVHLYVTKKYWIGHPINSVHCR